MKKVQSKDTIRVHYTGRLKNGKVFDTTVDKDPLEVELGKKYLIPGFESGVLNMEINEKKTIVIPVDEAYGKVVKEYIQEVDLADLPKDIDFKKGMTLMSQNPDGSELPLIVKKVNEDSLLLDANHPLAGKELTFDLQLIEIL